MGIYSPTTGLSQKHLTLRWCAAGMVEAGEQFRRVNGPMDLAKLRRALDAHVTEALAPQVQHEEVRKLNLTGPVPKFYGYRGQRHDAHATVVPAGAQLRPGANKTGGIMRRFVRPLPVRPWRLAVSLGVVFAVMTVIAQPASAHYNGGVIFEHTATLCADVPYGHAYDGQKVQQYGCNNSSAQIFDMYWVKSRTDGTRLYEFRARNNNGVCLSVADSAWFDGAKVILRTCSGYSSQLWASGAGGSWVVNHSRKCLDVPYNTSTWGVQLQQYTCNGSAAQWWNLKVVNLGD